ncbi:hypothetical protein ACFWN2_04620 [Lentzea sp. NPDC058436]|uniref:hypothetical protein n=1 Tax=Lentzea sp. NPDC058436 TaxID=3346499 RepID=UPI00365C5A68
MVDLTVYFSGTLVSIAIGVACAGLPTVATTWRTGQLKQRRPSEPGFSVGLVLVYGPAAYGLGGLVFYLVPSSNPYVNASISLFGWVCAHVTYLMGRRTRQSADTGNARFAGLTDLYHLSDPTRLRGDLASDAKRVTHARLIAPHAMVRSLGDPHSPMGEILRGISASGIRLEILVDPSDGKTLRSHLTGQHVIVGKESVDWPSAWLIASIGRVMYFGPVGSAGDIRQLPIVRGERSDSGDSRNLADAMYAISEMLFSDARGHAGFGKILTASSPKDYRERIVPAEAGATTVERLPKRLSVIFKSESTVRSIAEQRFGPASKSVVEYVNEHNARRAEFFAALARGMTCREIYNEAELLTYVASRRHSSKVKLSTDDMSDTVRRWREALTLHENYVVGITTDPLPLKYELIDGRLVVMHEAIGVADAHRLNAIFIHSATVGASFTHDFDTIWDRIPPDRRSRTHVLNFIDQKLIPLIEHTEELT